MIDELVAGIKNAMERGYSAEQAAQSFTNAGYNPAEVREAVNILTRGATAIVENTPSGPAIKQKPVQQKQQSSMETGQQALQQNPLVNKPAHPGRRKLIIALVILLIILIGGLITLIVLRDTLLSLLSGKA
jgi:hypothetical protein